MKILNQLTYKSTSFLNMIKLDMCNNQSIPETFLLG